MRPYELEFSSIALLSASRVINEVPIAFLAFYIENENCLLTEAEA